MWDIAINRQHDIGAAKVRAAAKKLIKKVGKDYGIKGVWEDEDTFVADQAGHVEEGTIKVSEKKVSININLDFLGRLGKAQIKKAIEDELDKVL